MERRRRVYGEHSLGARHSKDRSKIEFQLIDHAFRISGVGFRLEKVLELPAAERVDRQLSEIAGDVLPDPPFRG